MTVPPDGPPQPEDPSTRQADARRRDSGRLDDDPEALEDPVHRGDAQHQHALHESPPDPAD